VAPQYPYPPVYRPRRHSVVDITITSIVSAVAGIAALGSLWFSLFFAMATDSCGEQCDYAALNAAYLVTWGGVGVAVLLGASGIIVAAVHGWMMWIWPTLALVLIVAALLIGMLLANIGEQKRHHPRRSSRCHGIASAQSICPSKPSVLAMSR
jgi:hypothetical protein